jgi:hypothetical protein
MNTEMQKIMERRRKIAEEKARNGGVENLEGSLTDLDLQHSASNHSQGSAGENLSASGSFMSEDLQIKMERQRRLADGEIVEGGASLSPAPTKQSVKGVEMSPDLKAAMSKRRQLSDSKKAEAVAAAAPTARGTIPRHSRRSSTGAGPSRADVEGEGHRQSRRGSASAYVSSKTKALNSAPPPPPRPPVHQSDEGSIDDDGGDVEGKPRRSHRKSPPSRKSRPKKEETVAPMELDIDEDTSEEEEGNEEVQIKETKPKRRHRKNQDDSKDVSPRLKSRNLRRQQSDASEDIDDMSIDHSVDSSRSGSMQSPNKSTLNLPKHDESPKRRSRHGDDLSVDQSLDSKGSSSRSGSMMSPKKPSSSRPPKTTSGSHAKRRQSTGVSSTGTASGSGSSTDDDDAKLKRRSGRRKSTAGGHDSGIPSASGSGSSRRSMKKTGSSRSINTDEGSAAGTSTRNMMRRSSTRSMDTEPIMEDHSLSPLKEESKSKMEVVASESAWGEFPTFADANEGDGGTTGFSGGFANFSGGGNLGASVSNFGFTPPDADRQTGSLPPPAADKKDMASTDAFSAAFSGDADAVFSDQAAFEANAFGGPGGFDSAGGFDQSSFFAAAPAAAPKPKQKVWDSTPLTDVPKTEVPKLSLIETMTVRCMFEGAPSSNPMNGNIIFCSSRGGIFSIHEIDPHKNNVQVSSVTVLSTELQRKLASKYNASAHSVDSVIALTAGLHRAHGQTRVRVAAILDLRVLESDQVMRIVAVWQWGYGAPHPVLLQHVMIPPSGGEFTYDAASLQVADGLLFIAGTSKKGPCVFASKPAVRETWSANFLSGKGRVSAMAVTPDVKRAFPYIAVALTDHSLSVWTYGSALSSGASKGNEASPRWLFPLCRLEGQSVLADVPATLLNENESGGKGKSSTRFAVDNAGMLVFSNAVAVLCKQMVRTPGIAPIWPGCLRSRQCHICR